MCSAPLNEDTLVTLLQINRKISFIMALYQSASGLRDRMTCRICLEKYDNKTHVPTILPCQHTFCQSCICTITDRKSEMECSLCKAKHTVPSNGFTMNRAVLDIIEELDRQLDVPTCDEHTNKECILICIDCLIYLCAKCIIHGHHKNHNLKEPSMLNQCLVKPCMGSLKYKNPCQMNLNHKYTNQHIM